MANEKISGMPTASGLTGAELVEVVQGGDNKKTTTQDIANLGGSGSGTVTNASVVSANGFAGSVATATTTPAITLSTTITGLLKGNGTAMSAAVSGTDIKTIAGTSLLGSGNVALQGQTIGDIYSENFATGGTLASYTNVGSGTATATGTDLDISGGTAGVTTNYLHRNLISSITNNYRHVIFSPTSDVNGEAIGIGLVSRSSVTTMTVYVTFCPANVTNRGQLKIHAISAAGVDSVVATSSANISYTNGDLLDIIFTYGSTGNVEVTVKNLSASVSPVHVEYVSPNTLAGLNAYTAVHSPALYPFGGVWSVYLDAYGTNDSYGPLIVRAGDSITAGLYSGAPNLSEPGFTSNQLSDGKLVTFACGGNTAENLYNSFSQVLTYAPSYVAIEVGANDIGASVPLGTISTPNTYLYFIEQMVQLCFTNSIIPIICYITPQDVSSQSTINTWNAALLSNFGGRCIVLDWSTQLISAGGLNPDYNAGDNLHILYAGLIKMSEYFIANTPLHWYARPTYGVFPSAVTIGLTNGISLSPNFGGYTSLPAGSSYIAGANTGGLQLITSQSGAAGVGGGFHYYDVGGGAYKLALSVANVASGFGTLQLMPAGGKVGILNASPSEALDVTGNVRFSGALMPNNAAGTSGQVLTSAGSGAAATWTDKALEIITGGVVAKQTQSSGSTTHRTYETLWIDAAGTSVTQDINIMNGYTDATASIRWTVAAIKSDGSISIGGEYSTVYNKDGGTTVVQVGTTHVIWEEKPLLASFTASVASNLPRVVVDSGSADSYRWTVFAKVTITQL